VVFVKPCVVSTFSIEAEAYSLPNKTVALCHNTCCENIKLYGVTGLSHLHMGLRHLSKTFGQHVYKKVILQILGYINVVHFKYLPIT